MTLDKDTLPTAIGNLLKLNGFSVEYGREIHGSEVDIVARHLGNPLMPALYIEATIQNVDNTKYGKDLTKFTLLRRLEPTCICMCVSTGEFTSPVRERAKVIDVELYSYDELFKV